MKHKSNRKIHVIPSDTVSSSPNSACTNSTAKYLLLSTFSIYTIVVNLIGNTIIFYLKSPVIYFSCTLLVGREFFGRGALFMAFSWPLLLVGLVLSTIFVTIYGPVTVQDGFFWRDFEIYFIIPANLGQIISVTK